MLIAHLPAGYLLGRVAQTVENKTGRALIASGMLGSFAPDFDMLYFHFVDHRQTPHHQYVTHWPLFWLLLSVVLAGVSFWRDQYRLSVVVTFCSGAMLHMVMDSVAAPIHWLAPFSPLIMELVTVPRIHPNWIVSFLLHWTFLIEIIICTLAVFMFARRRIQMRHS